MSNVQLVNRLIVNVCEIPGEKIKSGRLRATSGNSWTLRSRSFTMPRSSWTIPRACPSSSCERKPVVWCVSMALNVIIDYLQLMNASGMNFGSREQEVSTISRSLKGLAKELNIPIIALSQLNRGVEARQGVEGKRPQLADLRESGAIEQDADMVCFIHRPEYYKITEDERGNSLIGLAEIIIAKHRNGAVGMSGCALRASLRQVYERRGRYSGKREFSSTMNGGDPMLPIPSAGS